MDATQNLPRADFVNICRQQVTVATNEATREALLEIAVMLKRRRQAAAQQRKGVRK